MGVVGALVLSSSCAQFDTREAWRSELLARFSDGTGDVEAGPHLPAGETIPPDDIDITSLEVIREQTTLNMKLDVQSAVVDSRSQGRTWSFRMWDEGDTDRLYMLYVHQNPDTSASADVYLCDHTFGCSERAEDAEVRATERSLEVVVPLSKVPEVDDRYRFGASVTRLLNKSIDGGWSDWVPDDQRDWPEEHRR